MLKDLIETFSREGYDKNDWTVHGFNKDENLIVNMEKLNKVLL